jgi:hypothetical protein
MQPAAAPVPWPMYPTWAITMVCLSSAAAQSFSNFAGSTAPGVTESFVTALGLTMGIRATTTAGEKGRDSGTIRLSGAEAGR